MNLKKKPVRTSPSNHGEVRIYQQISQGEAGRQNPAQELLPAQCQCQRLLWLEISLNRIRSCT